MSCEPSLADKAVAVLAAIKELDSLTDDKHPLKYAVYSMKGLAEKILSDALYNALELTDKAKTVVNEHNKAIAEIGRNTQ